MKKRMFAKKFTAVSLAAVMAFGGAGAMIGASATAWAAEIAGITSADTNATYTAYQVFTGTVDGTKLKNIQWGDGVNPGKLVEKLQGDATFVEGEGAEAKNRFAGISTTNPTAAEVAAAMKGLDEAQAKKFAEWVLDDAVKGTPSTMSSDKKKLDDDPGYYVFEGATSDTEKFTASSPIMTLTGDMEIAAKNGTVEVDKDILEVDGGKGKAAKDEDVDENESATNRADANDYNVGDYIPHEVTGTLPENLKDFKVFRYNFTDTMSPGLDFVENDTDHPFTVKVDGNAVEGTKVNSAEALAFTESDTVWFKYYVSGKTVLQVNMNPYKMPSANKSGSVVLNYYTKLNSNAVIGGSGNKNTVKLAFDNDPKSGGEGTPSETPQDENIVFTYELDNTKIDASNTDLKLKDAEFQLKNAAGKFAVINKATGFLIRWADAPVTTDTQETLADGTTTITTTSVLKSDADGNFNVKGLDAGKYTLVETKAPSGYNLPSNPSMEFEIKATVNGTEQKVANDADRLTDLGLYKTDGTKIADGTKSSGTVAQDITNSSETDLPSTGGMGTTIFTIVGIALMGGALVITVSRRRREQE